ncbi:MAG: hypothetical protein J5621_08345 [Paludibacteraceae bacterium]|nr:hypothetical protein [Paludibacteraceae bacterium]
MSLTLKQIRILQALLKGDTLAWSAINKELLQLLVDEQLVTVKTHRSRKTVYAHDAVNLQSFLEQHFEELRGFDWSKDDISFASSRAELAADSGNSKSIMLRSCPGFMANSFDPIPARLGQREIIIAPDEGTMLFVADWEYLTIPENVHVVGVENMENFRRIREQRHLFPTNQPLLFVSRYPQSTDLRKWLLRIPNYYLHFGDFDLAGMNIYETEFYNYLGSRASFLIPDDIEARLKNGSAERYNAQYKKFKNYKPTDKRLQPLFNMINNYHRCYDQEGYILVNKMKNEY